MPDRIDRLRSLLRERQLPAALILDPVNVGYLSGFTGSTAALLLTPAQAVFITDSRYAVQARAECPGVEFVITQSSGAYADTIAETIKRLDQRELALEAEYVTLAQYECYQKRLEGFNLKPVSDLIAPLRRVKDAGEIAATRDACALADRAFEFVLTLLKPGAVEREIAAELEFFLKMQGAEKEAFDTIVASGPRSALPHGRAADRRLQVGDFITFDFGARLNGYVSDLTRTVVLGKATDRQREVYGVVLAAEQAAIAAIRPGAHGKAVDQVARDLIGARGFGEYFGHGLGHGLGRTVHDHVALSQRSELTLEPGMIVTVEPGIYIEGWGGVRIEDDVLVTETGCEVLTRAPRELIEVAT
jgi:Xaa-Pro aminopeptidase